jgi:hypothetical protein
MHPIGMSQLHPMLLRPFCLFWASTTAHSSRGLVRPPGPPRAHAEGADPLRVLLAGDDLSFAYGVLSYDLGLAGRLASHLSALTGRGVDIDVCGAPGMTTAGCMDELDSVDLDRYDALVLSVGATEGRGLFPITRWRDRFTALLDLGENTSSSLPIFALFVPAARAATDFPSALAPWVDRHVRGLNASMQLSCDSRSRVTVIPNYPSDPGDGRSGSSRFYDEWAALIAPVMRRSLDAQSSQSRPAPLPDESARQRSLDDLAILERPDSRIDRITNSTRDLFGAAGAAVLFIDRTRQWVKSSHGMDAVDTARIGEFSDLTIRTPGLMVVEDSTEDPRFRDHPRVTGSEQVRFYAGYPLESPDGRRVGALCIVDTRARTFSRAEASLLRGLALQVQSELWSAVTRETLVSSESGRHKLG